MTDTQDAHQVGVTVNVDNENQTMSAYNNIPENNPDNINIITLLNPKIESSTFLPSESEVLGQNKNCLHYNLLVVTNPSGCKRFCCYLSCIFGIMTSIIACFLILLALDKSKSDKKTGCLLDTNHYRYSYWDYYCIHTIMNKTHQENYVVTCSQDRTVNLSCMKLEEPHKYEVKCKDCGKIVKEGEKDGSLFGAIGCGVCGLMMVGLALCVYLI
jgi:hypothetical protein